MLHLSEETREEVVDELFGFLEGEGVLTSLEKETQSSDQERLLDSKDVEEDGHHLVHLDGCVLGLDVLLLQDLGEDFVLESLAGVLHKLDDPFDGLVYFLCLVRVTGSEKKLKHLESLGFFGL